MYPQYGNYYWNDSLFYKGYDYKRKAKYNTPLFKWINLRLKPIIGRTKFVVLDGKGKLAKLTDTIGEIRDSYKK